MARFRLTLRLLLITSLFASPAAAQGTMETTFPTQLFEPAMGPDTVFSVEGPQTADHLAFGLGLMLNYQNSPLVLYLQTKAGVSSGDIDLSGAQRIPLVEHQLTANVTGYFSFHIKFIKAMIGLSVPVNLLVTGNKVDPWGNERGDLSATGVGDIQLELKVLLLDDLAGFSLALAPIVTAPVGRYFEYGGDDLPTGRPRLVLGYRRGDFNISADIGYLFRKNQLLFSSEVGDQLLYGVGAGYQVHKRVGILAEVFGRAGFGTQSGCGADSAPAAGSTEVCSGTSSSDLDAFPLEAMVGARVGIGFGLDLTGGVGVGIIRGIGSPKARGVLGLRWAPDFRDTDGDGVYDADDRCPTQAEDRDGHEDNDGCPDPDNDGDLIPDVRDKCPNQAEDKDTFEDDDGCPDPDNDGDGILDLHDECPFEAETKNDFKDEDGCPDIPDEDGDGIENTKDICPKEPEDKDGFKDDDGCPDPDNDGDGVPDSFDDCPNDPEDMDGFKDDDGCPDPDNDGDGVADAQDKCPTEPETINGHKDEDGCPDRGESHVVIEQDRIVIKKTVYFKTGRAEIERRSHSILDEVAAVLLANPQVKGVRIEGHTDNRGDADKNKVLSQKRAEAVRDYLVGKGVAAGRLTAVGLGQERPIESNRTRRGRKKNRRVEFHVLDQAPAKVIKQVDTPPAE